MPCLWDLKGDEVVSTDGATPEAGMVAMSDGQLGGMKEMNLRSGSKSQYEATYDWMYWLSFTG